MFVRNAKSSELQAKTMPERLPGPPDSCGAGGARVVFVPLVWRRTMNTMKITKLLMILAAFGSLTACMSYYQVTDTVNGTEYYTKSVKNMKSGAVSFTDKETGARVTLQNSAVRKIDKDEYKENIR